MKNIFSSLRFRLILLVLLALLPAFGVILYQAQIQRSYIQQRVEEQALSLAIQASKTQSGAIRESQPLLSTLTQLFALADTPLEEIDQEVCNKFLAGIRPDGSNYANLGVISKDGTLVCSALPFISPVDLSDRAYFRGATETKKFYIGDYQIGGVTNLATINIAAPILEPNGQAKGVVFAALDLSSLSRLAEEVNLPSGTVVQVVDRNGIVLMRYPNPENWIGQDHLESPIVQLALASSGQGTARAPGLDGVDRLFSFASLGDTPGQDSPMVVAGIPAAAVFADVDQSLIWNLIILAIVSLLAMAGAWLIGDLLFLSRIRTLVSTAGRLASGDLSSRSGLSHGAGEISQLAGAFDDMAGALQAQMAEVQKSREDLQELAEEEAVMAKIGRIIGSSLDVEGGYSSFAEQVQRLIPWDRISITLVDSNSGTLTSEYHLGVPVPGQEKGHIAPLMGTLSQELVQSRTSLIVQNKDSGELITQHPNLALSYQAGFRSFILVPLISNDAVIGILHLRSVESNAYTERHLRLAERIGSQIVGPLASVQLYRLRIQAEEALRIAAQEARDRATELTRSNAELEQFAYIASHDLQEPLRSITGFTGLLAKRYKGQLDQNADRFMTRITEATGRMQRLINDLLIYSRVGREIKLQPTNCHTLVGQEIATMHTAIQEAGAVVQCDSLPTVNADATLLGHVFRNLIGNAIKFGSQAPPTVQISAEQKPDHWIFEVKDNGIGIAPEFAERIFNIFERLHSAEEYPGTGIGLSICKKAVESWGGQIWVKSAPGQGSTFYFTVPADTNNGDESGTSSQTVRSNNGTEGNLVTVLTK